MSSLTQIVEYPIPFLVVLTVLVFVHEFGHFWVARKCGVKIDTFSIGFGKELFGWNDRHGTRWKFSILPLGGYVKMFGDDDAASWTETPDTSHMTEAERRQVFANQPLPARAAIVAAGPIANFIFTIFVFAILFTAVGQRFTTPDVQDVIPGSAAEVAGIKAGDTFVSINGTPIERFEQIAETVQTHPGDVLTVVLRNNDVERTVMVTPRVTDEKDNFGRPYHDVRIGIKHTGGSQIKRLGPGEAVVTSFTETGHLISGTLLGIWQMVEGRRPADQMGGVIAIGQMSHDTAQNGVLDLIYFMALLSVNLGLLNLFPIPILDGGHLLFFAVEAVKGKPPGEAVMKYSFRFGLAVVLTLAIFANWNDLVHLGLLDFVKGHLS